MRMLLVSLFVLASTVLVAEETKDPANDRNPWNGFPKGSWIIQTDTLVRGDQERSKRTKLVRTDDFGKGVDIGLSAFVERDGVFPTAPNGKQAHIPGLDPALHPKWKLASSRSDNVVIDEVRHNCTVRQYVLEDADRNLSASVELWHDANVDIPYRELDVDGPDIALRSGVVRADASITVKESTQTVSLAVKSLKDQRKVADRTLVCVREEASFSLKKDGVLASGTIKRWLSNSVPGHVVVSITEGEIGGLKAKRLEEVEAFQVAAEQ